MRQLDFDFMKPAYRQFSEGELATIRLINDTVAGIPTYGDIGRKLFQVQESPQPRGLIYYLKARYNKETESIP